MSTTFRYQALADQIRRAISQGDWPPGSRLPGVRRLSQQQDCSVATVLAAYRQLETEGWAEARHRSGFYVLARRSQKAPEPQTLGDTGVPLPVNGQQMVLNLIRAAQSPDIIQLGAAVPDARLMPVKNLNRYLSAAARQHGADLHGYEFAPGLKALRQQIALRMQAQGSACAMDEVWITNGCQEALSLALRATTQAGDMVAIESPCFYGLLQILESLHLKAVEIPTHARDGMDLDALSEAVKRWPIKACVVVSNFSNPLGCSLSDTQKQRLVEFCSEASLPLIEDDVYGDLGFQSTRRSTCKQFDHSGNVLYCSSYSKSLSPGLRCGWILPGRYAKDVDALKTFSNLASPALQQQALADFLQKGAYDRHLRQLRESFRFAVSRMSAAIQQRLPADTRISHPSGGFVLWVELPVDVDTFVLAQSLLKHGISIAPGSIFSASGRFKNCLRISCACVWGPAVEQALDCIAQEIQRLAEA